jgi:hypothetical protein
MIAVREFHPQTSLANQMAGLKHSFETPCHLAASQWPFAPRLLHFALQRRPLCKSQAAVLTLKIHQKILTANQHLIFLHHLRITETAKCLS